MKAQILKSLKIKIEGDVLPLANYIGLRACQPN
jgi:hypothetical protein